MDEDKCKEAFAEWISDNFEEFVTTMPMNATWLVWKVAYEAGERSQSEKMN